MRLVMVTPWVDQSHPILGFIPTWVTHFAHQLERLWVITPRFNAETELPANVTVFQVGRDYAKQENVTHALQNFHQVIWQLTQHERVDGIFTHMFPKFALMAVPYAKLKRIPLVMWYTHTHVSWQLRLAEKLVDAIVTASPGSCRLDSPKVHVVGHGLDTAHFAPKCSSRDRHSDKIEIVSVGRISPSKNGHIIINAVNELVNQHGITDFRLRFVGDIPDEHGRFYLQYLQRLVADLNLGQYVLFTGAVPHKAVATIYQQSDIFVSASESGLDKAVLEAMACGMVPVVSLPEFAPTLAQYRALLMYEPAQSGQLSHRLKAIIPMSSAQRKQLGLVMRYIVQQKHDIQGLVTQIVSLFAAIGPAA
ncbi:MAG: glycosyltransferase family 4 protein [Anaerolineales bacterium]|nr:glycosyltransferase family 4 protein [Anaerolineales bacterium]